MDSSPPNGNAVVASLVSPTPRAVLGGAVLGTDQLGGGHVADSPLADLAVPLFRDDAASHAQQIISVLLHFNPA